MKFLIINSFRTMVYVAYFAIIIYGVMTGIYNNGNVIGEFLPVTGAAASALDIVLGLVAGWIAASVICGLIVTLLDIRDDINDRLPDARRDD